jgi:hypothetical protein
MTEQGPVPMPGQVVFLKENPAAYLMADAELALKNAQDAHVSGDTDREASFARMATLLFFVALEGLINFVYEYSEVPENRWRSLSIKEKWLRAAEECLPGHGVITDERGVDLYKPGDPIEGVADDSELFERFVELKTVRDGMVHVQPAFTHVPEDRIDEHLAREEFHPRTHLPKRLASYRCEHAQAAAEIFETMSARLDRCLKGVLAHVARTSAVFEFEEDNSAFDEEDAD